MINTKPVHFPIQPAHALPTLATRLRGRALPPCRYDVWMANLGPSEALLRDILNKRVTWAEFSRRYKKELLESGGVDARNMTIKNHGQKFTLRLLQTLGREGNITLMCHCAEDEPHCHRHLLQKVLAGKV